MAKAGKRTLLTEKIAGEILKGACQAWELKAHGQELSLRIIGLSMVTKLRELARYGGIFELILQSPRGRYYNYLSYFRELFSLRLDRFEPFDPGNFSPGSKTQRRLGALTVSRARRLGAGLAALAGDFQARAVVLSDISELDREFSDALGERAPALGLEVLSVSRVELPAYFFQGTLPRLRGLIALILNAFGGPAQIQELDLSALTGLERLRLMNSPLRFLPKGFSGLRSLRILEISNAQLRELRVETPEEEGAAERVGEILSGLEELNVSHTELQSLPEFRKAWGNLKRLELASTSVQTVPGEYLTTALEVLDLSDTMVRELRAGFFKSLYSLRELRLAHTAVTKLPDRFPQVRVRSLNRTGANRVPGDFPMLSLRILDLCGMPRLRRLPDWVGEAVDLQQLNLGQLQLDGLPLSLLKRDGSRYLDEVRPGLPPEAGCDVYVGGLRLRSMDTQLLLNTTPTLLREYLAEEKSPLRCGNVVFLGDMDAGKSALIHRLIGEGAPDTDGYGIKTWDAPDAFRSMADGRRSGPLGPAAPGARIRIVELSGFAEMQLLHPIFMTRDSLYVVTLDGRRVGELQNRALFWSRYVESYAPNSKLLLVITGADSALGLSAPLLRSRVFAELSPEVICLPRLEDGREPLEGIETLRAAIVEGVLERGLYTNEFPRRWDRALQHLSSLLGTRLMLPLSTYREICRFYGIASTETQDFLAWQGMNSLGRVMLRSASGEARGAADELKEDTVFFDMDWFGEGLYRIAAYARRHGGVLRLRPLWEYLVDNAHRDFSLRQVEMLADYLCAEALLVKTERGYLLPAFSGGLERHDGWIRRVQEDNTAVHYVVQCPFLPPMLVGGIVGRFLQAEELRAAAGGAAMEPDQPFCACGMQGLLLSLPEPDAGGGGTLLLLAETGAPALLHLYLSGELRSGVRRQQQPGKELTDAAEALFGELKRQLFELPSYLARQYRVCVEQFNGDRGAPVFTRFAQIPLDEIEAYLAAGIGSYYCGSLNQTYTLREFSADYLLDGIRALLSPAAD